VWEEGTRRNENGGVEVSCVHVKGFSSGRGITRLMPNAAGAANDRAPDLYMEHFTLFVLDLECPVIGSTIRLQYGRYKRHS